MTTLAFVDLETTGLDPNRHETWEVAVVVRGHEIPDYDGVWLWRFLARDLRNASADALVLSRYYARALPQLEAVTADLISRPRDTKELRQALAGGQVEALLCTAPARSPRTPLAGPMDRKLAIRWIAALLEGAVLVGNNAAFDDRFLRPLLHYADHAAAWQYRVVDVVALAAGHLRLPLPWRSEEVSLALGVEPPAGAERHTALEDALWAMRVHDAVLPATVAAGEVLEP